MLPEKPYGKLSKHSLHSACFATASHPQREARCFTIPLRCFFSLSNKEEEVRIASGRLVSDVKTCLFCNESRAMESLAVFKGWLEQSCARFVLQDGCRRLYPGSGDMFMTMAPVQTGCRPGVCIRPVSVWCPGLCFYGHETSPAGPGDGPGSGQLRSHLMPLFPRIL